MCLVWRAARARALRARVLPPSARCAIGGPSDREVDRAALIAMVHVALLSAR
eukprot:COSAG02_NODE_41185_length_397_cov_0.815436_1_plen_51_part_10